MRSSGGAMAKARRDRENTGGGGGMPTGGLPSPSSSFLPGMMAGATLAGVAAVVLLPYMKSAKKGQRPQGLYQRFSQGDKRPTARPGHAGPPAGWPGRRHQHSLSLSNA